MMDLRLQTCLKKNQNHFDRLGKALSMGIPGAFTLLITLAFEA